jgi:hypothetical protein
MPSEGRIPGPSIGFEVFVPGRQGIRAWRDYNPACGSADLLGTSLRGTLPRSFPWCRGKAAREVHLPGEPAGVVASRWAAC